MALNGPSFTSPKTFPIRPLTKGIILNQADQIMEDGSFLDLEGMLSYSAGLLRHPHFLPFAGTNTFAGNATLLKALWGSAGGQEAILVTDQFVYQAQLVAGYTKIPWNYTTGTVDGSSTTLTGHSTLWLSSGIKPGDLITVGSATYTIKTVASDTSMTTTASISPTFSGSTYSISRITGAANPYLSDAIVCAGSGAMGVGGVLILASQPNRLVYMLQGDTTLTELVNAAKLPPNGAFQAECIAYFNGQIFAGHIIDSTGDQRNKIQWGSALDWTDWSDATAFLYLPTEVGRVKRLLPLNNLLVAYLDQDVFVGTPSSFQNLPVAFQRYGTKNVGLVGARAIAEVPTGSWVASGHYFVSFDDIYVFTGYELTPIGTSVVKQTVLECQQPWRIMAAYDASRRRVLFGFPKSNDYIEEIWSFELVTKSWSYISKKTWMLDAAYLNLSYTLNDLGANALSSAQFVGQTLGDYSTVDQKARVYVENENALWKIDVGTSDPVANPDGTTMSVSIQIPSRDYNAPDQVKCWRRFGIKIKDTSISGRTANVVFTLQGSRNEGDSWDYLGTITIPPDENEGYLSIKMMSSTGAFLITSSSAVPTYTITEYTTRVDNVGEEMGLGNQAK